jgi:hypothetical protein
MVQLVVISARWRHLLLIPASGPLSRLVKAQVTCEWQVLDEECLLNSKFKSTHRMVKLITSDWRRHLSPISASSGIPCITRDGDSWTSIVHRTQIGNRRRSNDL